MTIGHCTMNNEQCSDVYTPYIFSHLVKYARRGWPSAASDAAATPLAFILPLGNDVTRKFDFWKFRGLMIQQPCHRCGFVSDRPTRFCRQCGAQLFVENEATSATTRQYAPQQSATPYDAPYQSQLAQARSAPDNRSNDQTPDTSRLYYDPMAPNYPNYSSDYQQAFVKKSGALKWILITLMCILLVSGAISVMVISAIRATQQPSNQAVGAPEAPGAPAPPPPPPGQGAGLEQYKYPNARMESSARAFGNETMTMTTDDSVSEVRDYYQKRLGSPMAENEDDASVTFKISDSPMILITINQDKDDSDKTQITVVRSNVRLPKMN
jgi:hypothetical protein